MRRIATLSMVLALCLSTSAFAMGKIHEATITAVHSDMNMMMVKDKSGQESEVTWTKSTKVLGKPMAAGETVHYKANMKKGKLVAYWTHVGEMGKAKAASKKKPY